MQKHQVIFDGPFQLEQGGQLEQIELCYHTSGVLHANSKVVWICHALTANSNPEEWWPGMVGEGRLYNSTDYFIICANFLGSCYGTTGPCSPNSLGNISYLQFPKITIRDMVAAHDLLRQHLNIHEIHTLIGSSVGGFQALEMAISFNCTIKHLIVLASNARVSPWSTAFNAAQRMAIWADKTYFDQTENGGSNGLKAARAMAMLSYRSYLGYNATQHETDPDTLFAYQADSYQQYQGNKLALRFDAYAYVCITYAVDSHNVGRNRGGVDAALATIEAATLLIGIDGDLLFPPSELKSMQSSLPNSQYVEITSNFGHDGFLLESDQITRIIKSFYTSK